MAILIEQYGCVGGMATVGLVGPFMTSYDTKGQEQIVKGIFQELVTRMVEEGGAIDPSEVDAGTDFVSFIFEAHHNATPFDPEVMKSEDTDMLQDLIVAATNEALRKSREMMAEEMKSVTGGLQIPGLF